MLKSASMVRRGSTVRVRQRALQKRRTSALSRSGGLAHRRTCGGYGAVYGAFASNSELRQTLKGDPSGETEAINDSELHGFVTRGVKLELMATAQRINANAIEALKEALS